MRTGQAQVHDSVHIQVAQIIGQPPALQGFARTKSLLDLIADAMAKAAIRVEAAHAANEDAPGSFDLEPAETDPDTAYPSESAA